MCLYLFFDGPVQLARARLIHFHVSPYTCLSLHFIHLTLLPDTLPDIHMKLKVKCKIDEFKQLK